MQPNSRQTLKSAAERELRARRRAEQKVKAENTPTKKIVKRKSDAIPEESRIPTQLFQDSPTEYLDLATGLVARHSPFKSRALRSSSSSGTLENPTNTRPKIVDLRRRGETSSGGKTPRWESPQSFHNPIYEESRKSVGELIQQFTPPNLTIGNIQLFPQPTNPIPPLFSTNIFGNPIGVAPPVIPQVPIVPVNTMASTRLKYTTFYGRSQDANDWLTEFLDTAQTNKEDAEVDLLRIFRGLMKSDAMHWYHHDLTPAIRGDWTQLRDTFLEAFRRNKSMSNCRGCLALKNTNPSKLVT